MGEFREATIERLDEGWLLAFATNDPGDDGWGNSVRRRVASATFAETLSRVADHFGYRIESMDLAPSGSYRAALAEYAKSGEPYRITAPPLTPEQEARLAATDPPDPLDVLNVEKAPPPCSYGDGS